MSLSRWSRGAYCWTGYTEAQTWEGLGADSLSYAVKTNKAVGRATSFQKGEGEVRRDHERANRSRSGRNIHCAAPEIVLALGVK